MASKWAMLEDHPEAALQEEANLRYLRCSSTESMLTRFPSGVRLFGNRIPGLLSCDAGGADSASLSASS